MPDSLSALLQLGLKPVALYGLYRLGLKLGIPQRVVQRERQPVRGWPAAIERLQLMVPLPEKEAVCLANGAPGLERLRQACDEILAGTVRLFGASAVDLLLAPAGRLEPWERYESGPIAAGMDEDIKFTWEPGRFGWAYTLGRGYYLFGDERCSRAFWEYTEKFLDANPPYLGPHWSSAQEAALRLIALTWSLRVFLVSPASTPERQERLLQAIADHAARIPATLLYARSQNNNHLLSEAAGLYTAGLLLEGSHPRAVGWRKLGWRWFQRGIQAQVAVDGSYSQHSANYQRLMLQIALWMKLLADKDRADKERPWFDSLTLERLEKATRWLAGLLDRESGKLPNLGPNDGAYIFPLTSHPFADYRPVLWAASRAFCRETPGAGDADQDRPSADKDRPLDEMSLWFGLPGAGHAMLADQDRPSADQDRPSADQDRPLGLLRQAADHSWAYLRAVRFSSRPGHADQLHLDLWWRGLNLAQDAGTYRYTASAPWDNALTHAAVHNTVTVDGLDQMRRTGRFLYLDWAHAEGAVAGPGTISAWHTGYRKINILHTRTVRTQSADCWLVEDWLTAKNADKDRPTDATPGKSHTFRLHWLLPDWPWQLDGQALKLQSPLGPVEILITLASGDSPARPGFTLVRAGSRILGTSDPPHLPNLGWVSPTYSLLQPALSLVVETQASPPVHFITRWLLPDPGLLPEARSLP